MGSVLKSFQNIIAPGPLQVPMGRLTLDSSNPIINGMGDCIIFGNGIENLGRGRELQFTTNSPGTWTTTAEGVGINSPNSSSSRANWIQVPNWINYAAGSFTLRTRFVLTSYTADSFGALMDKSDLGGNREIGVFMATGVGGVNWVGIGGSGDFTGGIGNTFVNFSLNVVSDFVLTRVGTAVTLYQNGLSKSTFTVSATTGVNFPLTFGRSNDNAWRCGVTMIAFQSWNRALSAEEVKSLWVNPYSFIMPAEYEMPMLFTGPSFISGWSRQSNLPVIGGGTF